MTRNHIIIALAAMALTSCSTVSHTASVQPVETQISSMTVADLTVDTTKVTKTVGWSWTPLRSVSMSETKTNAAGELLMEADADVLVEPQYVVKRRGAFRGGSVTVSGYPARYHNFRPMTREDAEMIAIANGTYTPGVPVIVDSNAAYSPLRKKGKDKMVPAIFRKEKKAYHNFISVVGGPMFDQDDDYESRFNIGLMYGHVGSAWGFYAKGSVVQAEHYYWGDSKTTGTFTVGAVKTLGSHVNMFVGIGVGGYLTEKYDESYYPSNLDPAADFAIPVELGWQWHAGRINALLGITAASPVSGDEKNWNFSPFVGVGYNF